MRRLRYTPLLAAAALIAALALAPSADQALGGMSPFEVAVAKKRDGNYVNSTRIAIAKDQRKSLWYRVENTSDEKLFKMRFDDDEVDPGPNLNVKWFRGKTNITDDVLGSGYLFAVGAGKSKLFQAKLRATANNVKRCVVGRASLPDIQTERAFAGTNAKCL